MDPRRLLTFRIVAHERSFSRAAETLALSQPSVSQQVRALETEVGARLIDRRPGGLELTIAGATLLVHADAIADRLELGRAQVAELLAEERTTLRLGAFPSAIGSLVPDVQAALRAQVDGARVAVSELALDALPDAVRNGSLHLAVAFQPHEAARREPDGLERVDLGVEPFAVALPSDHRLADADAVALADLAEEDWTAPSADGIVVRACREAGFEPRLTSVMRDQIGMRGLIVRGLAVSLVPGLLRDAFAGDIVLRPVAGGGPRRDLYALVPDGHRHPLVPLALDTLRAGAAALERQDV